MLGVVELFGNQGEHRAADHLVGAIAEDALGGAVPASDDAFERLPDDRVARRVHDRCEPGRASVQQGLGLEPRVERDLSLARRVRRVHRGLFGLEGLLLRHRHRLLSLGSGLLGDPAEPGVLLGLRDREPALPVHESAQCGDAERHHDHLNDPGDAGRAGKEVREEEIAGRLRAVATSPGPQPP